MKKQTRKIIASLVMLILSVAMLGSATYAWFAMNASVGVGGMSVTAGTPTNLLIATSENGTYGYEATFEAHTGSGKLLPVSTADPTDTSKFFALVSSASLSTNGGAAGSGEYQVASTPLVIGSDIDGYYIDYPIFLKTSAGSKNAMVYLSNVVITDKNNTNLSKAVRIALYEFADDGTLIMDYNTICGIDPNDASPGVNAIISVNGDTKATPTLAGAGTYEYSGERAIEVTSSPKALTLRVWIEGQDSDCANANAGANLSISVTFSAYEAP